MSELQIYTSFVSARNIKRCVNTLNLIPVFAMKKLFNSDVIGAFSDTALHLHELSPSNELYHSYVDGELDLPGLYSGFNSELEEKVDLKSLLYRFEVMAKVCGASGIVIMTYGRDPRKGYRPAISDYLNSSGLLEKPVYEI